MRHERIRASYACSKERDAPIPMAANADAGFFFLSWFGAQEVRADEFIWPLSGNPTTPDEMNTSFGPRIDANRWDFHDGIDLPAAIGTPVYAIRAGRVCSVGPGVPGHDSTGIHSRHVIIETTDPRAEEHTNLSLYMVYLHLDSIAAGIAVGDYISQHDLIGTVGEDDATYPHLHFEFRKDKPGKQIPSEKTSVHPLTYLPHTGTANFTRPVLDRWNIADPQKRVVRLAFAAPSKLIGDLLKVEVQLRSATIIVKRRVDFDDPSTVNKGRENGENRGKGDNNRFKNNCAIEGYQKSDMIASDRTDLHYGIILRDIPTEHDTVVAELVTTEGVRISSGPLPLPTTTDPSVRLSPTEFHLSANSNIELSLPERRLGWRAQAVLTPQQLDTDGGSVVLLAFMARSELFAAAQIRTIDNRLVAGIVVRKPDGTLQETNSKHTIDLFAPRTWRLSLRRLGTRETTAILALDEVATPKDELTEVLRVNWDSTAQEATTLRLAPFLGIEQSVVKCSNLKLSETI
jgi:hypothetical protein